MKEEEQIKAYNDYLKSSLEAGKDHKKKLKKILIFVVLILLSFPILFRLPFIQIFFQFAFNQNIRYYEVSVNNQLMDVKETIEPTTLIPNLFVVQNDKKAYFYFGSEEKFSIDNPVLLKVDSYTCYIPNKKKKTLISCSEYSKNENHMVKNEDTTYNLEILKYALSSNCEYYGVEENSAICNFQVRENSWSSSKISNYEIVYQGELPRDITKYVETPAVYALKIHFQYKNTKGFLIVGLLNDGENFSFL